VRAFVETPAATKKMGHSATEPQRRDFFGASRRFVRARGATALGAAASVRTGRTYARGLGRKDAETQRRKILGAARLFARTGGTIALGMFVCTGRTIAVGTPATFVRTGRTIARGMEHKDTDTQRSDRKREDRFGASRLLVRTGGTIARGMKHKGTKAQRSDRNSNGRKGHPIPILSSFAAAASSSSSPPSFSFSSSDLRVFVPLCSTPRAHAAPVRTGYAAPVRMNARTARHFPSSSSASDLCVSVSLCSILRAHVAPVRRAHVAPVRRAHVAPVRTAHAAPRTAHVAPVRTNARAARRDPLLCVSAPLRPDFLGNAALARTERTTKEAM
jgi:hypothetical protein